MDESLDAIAASQPLNLQLAVAAEHLEREQVLPLAATAVHEGHLLLRSSQQQEGVVIHRHVPEPAARESIDLNELAREPAGQVDEVHALIDQLAAA